MANLTFKRLTLTLSILVSVIAMMPVEQVKAQVPGQWLAEFFDGVDAKGPVKSSYIIPGTFLMYEIPPSNHPSGTSSQTNWSARFTSQAVFEKGNYKFLIRADDGARLYLNGTLAFDASGGTGSTYAARVLPMPAGTVNLTLEYFEYNGDNYVELLWEKTTDQPGERDAGFVVPGFAPPSGLPGAPPSAQPTSVPTSPSPPGQPQPVPGILPPAAPNQWLAQFFDGTALQGPVRNNQVVPGYFLDYEIPPTEHPSGTSSQVNWSARFTSLVTFQQSNYKFLLRADDGARMYINGALAFDASGGTGLTYAARVLPMPAGTYTVSVEYFEYDGENYVELLWEPTTDKPGELDQGFVPPGGSLPTAPPDPGAQPTADPSATQAAIVLPTQAPPRTGVGASPPQGGILVDETPASGFSWSGAQDWQSGTGGLLNNRYVYSDNSQYSFRIWGRWNIVIPTAGNYDVYVYVPNHPGLTTNARYRVFHAGVLSSVITVDQAANHGRWVSLGTYFFARGGTQFLYLNDLTFEPSGVRDVVYDAAQFVATGN